MPAPSSCAASSSDNRSSRGPVALRSAINDEISRSNTATARSNRRVAGSGRRSVIGNHGENCRPNCDRISCRAPVTSRASADSDVGGEQGATDDRQGEARHLGVQVQSRAVGPAVGGSFGFSHHGVSVGVDALVVEDRLDQAALSPMGLVLAGEEAVPEHTAGVLQRRALVEVVVAGREDVPDIVRVIDEVDVGARHHRVGQITDRGGPFQQGDRDPVAAAGRPRAWRDRAR